MNKNKGFEVDLFYFETTIIDNSFRANQLIWIVNTSYVIASIIIDANSILLSVMNLC